MSDPENVDAVPTRGPSRPRVARPDRPGVRQAGTGAPATAAEAPPGLGRGRRAPNWDEPGLGEALAAYNAFLDEVVTESQHCTRREDPERLAYLGDIIERAAARARERDRAGAASDTSQGAGR